jgi:putative PIN family toxin of toxin-antitoxin system
VRVVFDVNVLLRAVIGSVRVAAILERAAEMQFVTLTSDILEDEFTATARKPRIVEKIEWAAYNRLISFLTTVAERVRPGQPFPACRDPKDGYLLAMAEGGRADFLVTRDDDLLSIGRLAACEIVTPEAFELRISQL